MGDTEKLAIDVTADTKAAQKAIDALEKSATALEKLDPEIEVQADTKSAAKAIDGIVSDAKELGQLDPEISVDADVRRVLSAFDDIESEARRTAAVAEALGRALGPELAAQADPVGLVEHLKSVGLTMDQIEGDADALGAKLREMSDADVGGKLGASLGTARGKMDELGKSADSSKSVLANMVGNSAQDLGALSGVAGSAGVAFGQMGEYMADARASGEGFGSILKSFGGVAVPVAALGLAMQFVSSAMEEQRKRAEAAAKTNKELADDLAGNFAKIEDAADVGLTKSVDLIDQMGVSFIKTQDDAGAVIDAVLRLGGGLDDVGGILASLQTKTARLQFFESFLANSGKAVGATRELASTVAEAMEQGHGMGEVLAHAMTQGGDAAVDFINANHDLITALEALQEAGDRVDIKDVIAQTRDELLKARGGVDALVAAQREVGDGATAYQLVNKAVEIYNTRLKEAADSHKEITDAIALRTAEQEFANKAETEAADLMDRTNSLLQDHSDALLEDADALKDQADAFASSADDQITYNDAMADFTAKAKDSKASTEDIRDAAIDAAKAHAQLYTSMTEASGATATATGKLDAQNQSLIAAARQASGPSRQAIIDYIATLNGISAEKATQIVATADVAQAETDLADASVARDMTITADAETVQADKDLDKLTQPRTITILTKIRGPQATGGITPPEGGIAGEAGPEFIKRPGRATELLTFPMEVPPGTNVTSVRRTRAILSRRAARIRRQYAGGTASPAPLPVVAAAAGMTFVYEQNAPVYGVEDLDRHLAAWSQRIAQQISVGRRS